ncbi:MAG: hypothetical protein K0R09_2045 [Clostridiales bacterium]|nr:hypothetical protein [Clostridiales bacterium]
MNKSPYLYKNFEYIKGQLVINMSGGKFMDRRTQKTKAAIYEAFNSLLSEKKYSKITIQRTQYLLFSF